MALAFVVSACSNAVPVVEGAGWPNVALSAQTVTKGSVSVTVRPTTIGPPGAQFEVEIALPGKGVSATPIRASLRIDGEIWPSPQWEASEPDHATDGVTVFHLSFDAGGSAIGQVELEIERSGSLHVFDWQI